MGDVVLVGSCKGFLYSLDRHTGEVIWQYDISQDGEQSNFHGDPLVLDDVVYIGTDGTGIGHMYAFDLATGAVWWSYPDDRGVATDVVSLGDAVYGSTLGDELLCLDRDTGAVLWSYNSATADAGEDFFNGTPAITPEAIFFGGMDGTLRALEPSSGELLWAQPLGARITTSLLHQNGFVFAGTDGGVMYRVEAATGAIARTMELSGTPSQAIVTAGGNIAVFLDWAQAGGVIAALDTSLTAIAWQRRAGEGDLWTSARPYRVDDTIVVGSKRGKVTAFEITDGRAAWSITVDGTARGLGFTDEEVYVGTLNGKVYCVERSSRDDHGAR